MSGLIGQVGARSGVVGTTEIDYEEGTWTPRLTIGNGTSLQKSGGNMTYSSAFGKYTKIGNIVLTDFYVNVNAASTDAASYYLGDLPFTNRDMSSHFTFGMQMVVHANVAQAAQGVYFCEMVTAVDRAHIRFQVVDGSTTSIQSQRNANVVIGSSTWLAGKIQYYVN